ncbi:helix-turn-helix domain-containing protein [Paenibacillus pasadenensis]|uniref:helix-turn-helix domain-containing protein n=1 Tax=Paenibacillus pasadenensis TaxID=217090 RepID=UPI00041B2A17|nr:helix-turn-helix transcriptional regulator [Paenibacillus pasadenensis]
MSTIGERIKRIRKIYGHNQVDFSNIIGVSQGTLSELEQDKYKPALDTIMQIYNKFNTDIYWLLFGVEQHNDDKNRFGKTESELILQFRKLNLVDQEEILDIIQLKLNRYNKVNDIIEEKEGSK